ncbi:TatD family hydrolase [Endozoicomonas sp. 8E]|uniref:TatD family hydrolase n=1 Tax=Endozoicomonas sp. 8E TaxID=3035692 RepID=UPI002938E0BF|nr:TatD family hydrolase [Endozoicomonas sp. 8E]WOG26615.1 TatD family hydrolase [Endozoicomonas sp. 8E]
MINSNNTTGTVGGSNPNTSQPVQPQLQEAGEGARFGRTVSTGDSNNILSVRTPDFSHSQTGRSTTSSPDGRFVKVDDEKAILPNITSPSSVSPHGVSSKGTQWAADEADLKVWQEGRSKPRKMKKKKRSSGSTDKPSSGVCPIAFRYSGNTNYHAVQGRQVMDQGLESRYCQRSTGATALPDAPARDDESSGFQLATRPESGKVNLTPPRYRPQYMTPLVDIGANLVKDRFDLPQVLAEASRAGVGSIMITGTSISASKDAQKLVAQWSEPSAKATEACGFSDSPPCSLYYTVGCHPHNAKNFRRDGGIRELRKILKQGDRHCIAVGECGLDYDREWSFPDVQRTVFRKQLALAAELKKPLFLHERLAHDDFIGILKDHINQLPSPAMACVHCFTGNSEQLQAYLDLGCSIGITGYIGDKRNKDLVKALRSVGWETLRERLMVETDAPFLKPYLVMPERLEHRRRGKRENDNEPANLPYVIHALSQVLGVDGEEIAAATTDNARRIFSLGD